MSPTPRSARAGLRAAAALAAASLALSACATRPAAETTPEEEQTSPEASTPPGEFTGVSVESVPGSDGGVRQLVLESSNEGTVDPYDAEVQQAVADTLDRLAADEEPTADEPLLALNPFGTNTTGLWARFTTPGDGTLSYTVSSPGTEDWTRTAVDASGDPAVFETQLVGVVPGAENTVTTTFRPADGSAPLEHEVRLTAPEARAGHPSTLERTGGEDVQELTDGLFVLPGVDGSKGANPLVDNHGVVRGEIVGRGYRADRIEFYDGTMVVPVGLSTVAQIDPVGRAVRIHELDGLKMHHDLVLTDEGEAILLVDDASKDSVEDVVAVLDLETGESRVLLDFDDLMGSYKEQTVEWAWGEDEEEKDMDWLHFNSVDLLDEDTLVLSARETSSVITVDDIRVEPTVNYLMGEDDVWQGSDYEDLALEKRGDFPDHGGQHTVVGVRDESAGDGRHWVELYDNNFWQMRSRPDYEGEVPEGASTSFPGEEGDVSRVRRYLVDERARTYELVEEFEVPYSSIVSSVQRHDGHLVVASGMAKVFGEYEEDGTLLAQYTIDTEELLVYRVLKYDFEDFWFSGEQR